MRIILLLITLLLCLNAFSATNRVICPESIVCNYERGICSYPIKEGWVHFSGKAKQYFKGALRINFSEASIYKNALFCFYSYDLLNNNFFVLVHTKKIYSANSPGWYWDYVSFGTKYKTCKPYAGARSCSVLVKI